MNKLGTCCFPAALVWGRAMLHLFQWRLSVAGRLQIHEVQDPRLNVLVRGWDRGPELKPGIRAVVSRVLCAQAIALEDSETLEIPSAALPATIVLARLLHGCGSADIQAFHVPVEPPPTVQATNRGTVASLQHLPVKHLIPGTPDALAVALRHLEQVVGRFKIEGRRLDLNSVLAQGPGQLANSEALWEAVELYRAIKRDLAELSSG